MEELIYLIIQLIVKGAQRIGEQSNKRAVPPPIPATRQQVANRLLTMSPAPRRPAPPIPPAKPIVATPTISLAETSWVDIDEAAPQSPRGASVLSMRVPARTLRERFIAAEVLRAPVSLRPPTI